jgi:hypothetical protein
VKATEGSLRDSADHLDIKVYGPDRDHVLEFYVGEKPLLVLHRQLRSIIPESRDEHTPDLAPRCERDASVRQEDRVGLPIGEAM